MNTRRLIQGTVVSVITFLGLLCLILNSAQAQNTTIIRVSSFDYNAQGLLIKEVIEPDNPQLCLATTHGYDAKGNKAVVTRAACSGATGYATYSASSSRSSSTTYTTDGRFPAVMSNALGQSEATQHDERFGQPTRLVDTNGLTTTWVYDGFGRKTREERADGTYSTWIYQFCAEVGANCPASLMPQGGGSSVGFVAVTQIPVWVVTERLYSANNLEIGPYVRQYHDGQNRVIRVETLGFDGEGIPASVIVHDTQYNSLGQLRRKSNNYNASSPSSAVWVVYAYDDLGRLSDEISPDNVSADGNAIKRIIYNGLSTTITNNKGQSKTTVKDAFGRISRVSDAYGGAIQYQYDPLGQLTQVDAAGNITKIEYNTRGHKTRMQDPAMGVWEYAYNVFGEFVFQLDGLGQSSVLTYDVLSRLTQRNEPDLISNWAYDNCAKGVGRLCQASSENGYKRTHNYDNLGRAVTTTTKLDATVTTAVTYETGTGRVASQTYPTGYQVSYQYTPLGFIKSVVGLGAGITQTATYTVEAVNAQGQIMRYRYGNRVITSKTYDAQTGRLQAITATKDGLANGGIQQTTYQYDSLSNLTARSDVNTGVQEIFLYDNLKRLTNYQAIGGSVTAQDPSADVQVMYDSRGNIAYKSDVGRYWYDPQRPNRLTNITLEAPSGATALSGTRALAYAFDDYSAGAKTLGTGMGPASGMVVGNGNLLYTVNQDSANGRHSIRWERHTSFNMPQELALFNLSGTQTSTAAIQAGSVCPVGTSESASECWSFNTTIFPAVATTSCDSAFSIDPSSNQCFTSVSVAFVNLTPSCVGSDAAVLIGEATRCVSTVQTSAAACTAYVSGNNRLLVAGLSPNSNGQCAYYRGSQCVNSVTAPNGTECIGRLSQPASIVSYRCPAGTSLIDKTCIQPAIQAASTTPTYSCPVGYNLNGSSCTTTRVVSATLWYTCPAGSTLSGTSTCTGTSSQPATASSYCPTTNLSQSPMQFGTPVNGICVGLVSFGYPPASFQCSEYGNYYGMAVVKQKEQYIPYTACGFAPLISYSCPTGFAIVGTTCISTQTTTSTAIINWSSCPGGYTQSGTSCIGIVSKGATASCSSGNVLIGTRCYPVTTHDKVVAYSCPAGSTLSGNRCFANNITTSQVTNRTLTFVYGPEHQRISQRTQLDATAPNSMSAGTVYYLNEQNNDLVYEKEVKGNGLVEHKHYLSAGGMVFAMHVSRSGNLATGGPAGSAKPAQSLQYLHTDHLGSVSVVTDETGSVIERLAYDPWGKRRFPNGTADTADGIVGLTLDRGFTLHEHLDEVGVIHMNGRIFDPLIARFMSADPNIPDPHNLKSYNRYSYVQNNPLTLYDPSGFAEEYGINFTGGTYYGPNADYGGYQGSFAGYGFSIDYSNVSNPISPVCSACSSQWNGINSPGAQIVNSFLTPQEPGAVIGTTAQLDWSTVFHNLYGRYRGQETAAAQKLISNAHLAGERTGQLSLKIGTQIFIDLGPGGGLIDCWGSCSVMEFGLATIEVVPVGRVASKVAQVENYVYRGLAKGEDAAAGLFARSPGAGNSPISHVAGKDATQWISTTKDLNTALTKYGEYGVVRIDLNKVGSEVLDVSGGFANGGRMSNWARRDQEVLIRNVVSPDAIVRIK